MYLGVAVVAWAIAQICKYILVSKQSGSFRDLTYLYKSGSMPSVHAATVVSLTVYIGLHDGFHSNIFALAAIITVIVLYDAVQVRRAVGEQGIALRGLLNKANVSDLPHAAMGHTPLEVLAGSLIGSSVGIVAFFITI